MPMDLACAEIIAEPPPTKMVVTAPTTPVAPTITPPTAPEVKTTETSAEPPPSCVVKQGDIPANFMAILKRLDTPTPNLPVGDSPLEETSNIILNDPMATRDGNTLPQSRPRRTASNLPQVYSGSAHRDATKTEETPAPQRGISRHQESGVTVYRGR